MTDPIHDLPRVGDLLQDARGRFVVTYVGVAGTGRVVVHVRRGSGAVGTTFADLIHARLRRGETRLVARDTDPDALTQETDDA
jgi:hypothetical protein